MLIGKLISNSTSNGQTSKFLDSRIDLMTLESLSHAGGGRQIEDYLPESHEIDWNELKESCKFRKKRYNNAVYFGETEGTLRSGKGVMKYKNGRIYEGDWLKDGRNGDGYERYVNGNIYHGLFENGKAHGKGIYKW